MNADRLHSLLLFLQEDLNRTDLVAKTHTLRDALNRSILEPHPNHEAGMANALTSLYQSLNSSTVKDLSPAWSELVQEIGYSPYLGEQLRRKIEEIFQRNKITLTIARDEIVPIGDKLSELKEAVAQGVNAMKALSIGTEKLSPGECELGFIIPRLAVKDRLDSFAAECKEFDLIFSTFSEVAMGSSHHYHIKTISSSDLSVFLESAPAVAALVAAAAERILAVYKQMLEIKKLKQDLLAKNVPATALTDLDKHENSRMVTAVDEITLEIISEYCVVDDPGRRNELQNATRISLNKLANRIDRGYHIEVRVGPPPQTEKEEEIKAFEKHSDTINKALKNLEFIRVEGEPLLTLPEEFK
jgi:hypothetical protein